MSVNLTSVKNASRSLNVPVGRDGSINLDYYPNRYTPDLFEEARQFAEQEGLDSLAMTAYVYERVLKSWDIVVGDAENPEPLAITAKNILSLPVSWIKEIDSVIEADLNPTTRSGKNR